MDEKRNYGYRSFFWPILLIGIGVIWLLANFEILPDIDFVFLLRLWPIALIAIGLDILFGRRSPVIGGVIGLIALGLVIGILLLAPTLGIETSSELKTLTFHEALGNARSARVTLDLERYPTTVDDQIAGSNLVEAELETFTDVRFRSSGDESKTISIAPVTDIGFGLDWRDLAGGGAKWKIHLDPNTPTDLEIDVGSGSADLELGALEITDLRIDGGSGSVQLRLPASSGLYEANLDGGSGSFDVEVAGGADIDARLHVGSGSFSLAMGPEVDFAADVDGGSGSFSMEVGAGSAVRIVVRDRGSGSVNVPSQYVLIDDLGDNDRDTGIWETPDYASAAHRIEITFDPGSGSINVR